MPDFKRRADDNVNRDAKQGINDKPCVLDSQPKAAARFISGKVSARPEMANGPTPWPMKILSTML